MPAVRVKTELLESEQGVSRGFCATSLCSTGDPSQASLWLAVPLVLSFSFLHTFLWFFSTILELIFLGDVPVSIYSHLLGSTKRNSVEDLLKLYGIAETLLV